jgi:hypothetical protein
MVAPENWGVPNFDIETSDPVDTATGVAVNKTITLTFPMPLHPPVTNANITETNTTKGAGRLGSYPTYEKHYRVFTKKQGKLRELAKMIRNE